MNGILCRTFINGTLITLDNNTNDTFNVGGYPNSVFRSYLYLGKSNWFNDNYYDVRVYNMMLNSNYVNKMYNGLF